MACAAREVPSRRCGAAPRARGGRGVGWRSGACSLRRRVIECRAGKKVTVPKARATMRVRAARTERPVSGRRGAGVWSAARRSGMGRLVGSFEGRVGTEEGISEGLSIAARRSGSGCERGVAI